MMRFYLAFVVLLATLGFILASSKSKDSGSNSSSNSKSNESSKSGLYESVSNESKECVKRPKYIVTMDVNRGVAYCGPEKIINTENCENNELYWIPCLIEYLGVERQPPPYTCFSLKDLDVYLNSFPCICKPDCPNGYGYNKTCIYANK